jgi:hypothetical protein
MSKPSYGAWALLRKGGVIGLELDVMPDGTVGTVDLRITRELEFDSRSGPPVRLAAPQANPN